MQLFPHYNEPNILFVLNPEPISDANFLGNSSRTICSLKDTIAIMEKFQNRNFSDKDIKAILKFCPNQYVSSKSTIPEFRSVSVILN